MISERKTIPTICNINYTSSLREFVEILFVCVYAKLEVEVVVVVVPEVDVDVDLEVAGEDIEEIEDGNDGSLTSFFS